MNWQSSLDEDVNVDVLLVHETLAAPSLTTTTRLFLRWLSEEDLAVDNDDNVVDDSLSSSSSSFPYLEVFSNVLLFFLMFGLSATVQLEKLQHQLNNKLAICTGAVMQFLIMPILGFVAVLALRNTGFTPPMGITLMVVTASPGGSFSNWWCSTFNAEMALSVAMTSVSNLLSIGLLPANLFIYTWLAYTVFPSSPSSPSSEPSSSSSSLPYPNDVDAQSSTNITTTTMTSEYPIHSIQPSHTSEEINVLKSLDFASLFLSLTIVLSGVLLGLWSGNRYQNHKTFRQRAKGVASLCGLGLILLAIFLSTGNSGGTTVEDPQGGNGSTKFSELPLSFFVGVGFPCVMGVFLAHGISRMLLLSHPECVAIAIECCYQNTAIAISFAVTMFSDPIERAQAISVPFFYGCFEGAMICSYCIWAWKMGYTWAPANDPFCTVLTKTYPNNQLEGEEVGEDEDEDQHPEDQGEDMELGRRGRGRDGDKEDEDSRSHRMGGIHKYKSSGEIDKSRHSVSSEKRGDGSNRCRCGTEATATTVSSSTSTNIPPDDSESVVEA